MKVYDYIIIWGEIGIESFITATSIQEAILKFKKDIEIMTDRKCDINIKSIDIIQS